MDKIFTAIATVYLLRLAITLVLALLCMVASYWIGRIRGYEYGYKDAIDRVDRCIDSKWKAYDGEDLMLEQGREADHESRGV